MNYQEEKKEDKEDEEEEEEESSKDNFPKPNYQPPIPIPKEENGKGTNKFIYFVCNEPGDSLLK